MCTCASKVIIASYWLQYLSFLSVFSCISPSVIAILRSVRSALVGALRKESPHCSRGRFPVQLVQCCLFLNWSAPNNIVRINCLTDRFVLAKKERRNWCEEASEKLWSTSTTRVPRTESLEGIPIPKNYILPRQTLLFIVTFSLFSACILSTSVSRQRQRWCVNGFCILSSGII